jgi:hypothetical protein
MWDAFFGVEEVQMRDSEKVVNAFKGAGEPLRAGTVVEITGIDKHQVGKIIKSL